MKNFKQYLAESVRTYNYKIKIAGDPSENWLQLFTMNLSKFDPVNISKPKSTPIQKEPYGFPGLKDQSVTIIDVSFRYPAVEPMVKQMAKLLGHDENLVRLIQQNYDDSVNAEAEMYANQSSHSPLLDHSELEDGIGASAASKEYSQSYLERIKKQEDGNKIKNKYAAKETKSAFDPFDQASIKKSMGERSPMSSIKRPERPATGGLKAKK